MPDHEREQDRPKGVTRRGFLGTVGAGAVVAATGVGVGQAEAEKQPEHAGGMIPVALRVNGRVHRLLVEPRWSLLYVLREQLGLTGTKVGCERGECGACTVLIDGVTRYACMTLVVEAEGLEVTTIEGLMDGEQLGATQQAFLETDAFQCGYCTPGQIMAAEGLLRANPGPDLKEIRHGMAGNLCRCAAYVHIFEAVERAAELKKGGGR
ncbi:MAG: twin-arginine translocation signal domain-containing protein [Actinobacteria bacterium]|nr:MAG: twin-arginine translocation signal domain-containing protein [Actinomycetota bacterium]